MIAGLVEYDSMGYDYDFEAAYYKKADKIVTISQAYKICTFQEKKGKSIC